VRLEGASKRCDLLRLISPYTQLTARQRSHDANPNLRMFQTMPARVCSGRLSQL
jgi:hypothetical protein